jgi:hypothetical protein
MEYARDIAMSALILGFFASCHHGARGQVGPARLASWAAVSAIA